MINRLKRILRRKVLRGWSVFVLCCSVLTGQDEKLTKDLFKVGPYTFSAPPVGLPPERNSRYYCARPRYAHVTFAELVACKDLTWE